MIFRLAESRHRRFNPVMGQPLQYSYVCRSDAVAAEEQKQIRKRVRQMRKNPEEVKAFLIKGGFITKSGKLAKRYRD